MRNKKDFFFVLLFFFFCSFCVEISRGQNNGRTEVNVGVVTDVGTSYSDVAMHCINMSLADFYSSRPQFKTRLVVNVGDSRDDVIGAASAGDFSSPLSIWFGYILIFICCCTSASKYWIDEKT